MCDSALLLLKLLKLLLLLLMVLLLLVLADGHTWWRPERRSAVQFKAFGY